MRAGEKRLCTKTKDPSRATPTVAPTKIKHSLRSCKRAAVKTLPPNSCTVSTLQLNLTSTCEPRVFAEDDCFQKTPSELPAGLHDFSEIDDYYLHTVLPCNHGGSTCHNEHAYNDLVRNVSLIKPLQTWPARKAGGLFCINRKTSPEPIVASIWQRILQMLELFLLFLVKCNQERQQRIKCTQTTVHKSTLNLAE